MPDYFAPLSLYATIVGERQAARFLGMCAGRVRVCQLINAGTASGWVKALVAGKAMVSSGPVGLVVGSHG